jgi:hypothetical protein
MRRSVNILLLLTGTCVVIASCFREPLPDSFVWEAAGEKRAYDVSLKLEPIDSPVELTFLQRGERLFVLLTSKKIYRTMRYHFVGRVSVSQDTVYLDLIGIDGSRAISEALGCALSEIPFDVTGKSFVLEISHKRKKDIYSIILDDGKYRYTPRAGEMSEIRDYLDDAPGDGKAEIQKI